MGQRWQGYGVMAIGAVYLVLAVVGGSALDSVQLGATFAIFAVAHVVLGALLVSKAARGEIVSGFNGVSRKR